MKVNIMTVGQTVRIKSGKYANRIGNIKRLYTFADYTRVSYDATVAVKGVGKRSYSVCQLQVV